jgi:hypothetical protein
MLAHEDEACPRRVHLVNKTIYNGKKEKSTNYSDNCSRWIDIGRPSCFFNL